MSSQTENTISFPRYAELPQLELYMDQVLLILEQSLVPDLPEPPAEPPRRSKQGERPITASMINNYVKQGLIEPPRKKRYTRQQVASLLLICLLKNLLPIADIKPRKIKALRSFTIAFAASWKHASAALKPKLLPTSRICHWRRRKRWRRSFICKSVYKTTPLNIL